MVVAVWHKWIRERGYGRRSIEQFVQMCLSQRVSFGLGQLPLNPEMLSWEPFAYVVIIDSAEVVSPYDVTDTLAEFDDEELLM